MVDIQELIGKVTCADCMEILKELPDNSIDLIVTDPPYNIHTSGGGLITREKKNYLKNIDNSFGTDFIPDKYLEATKRLMVKYNAYWWHSLKIIHNYIDFAKRNKYNYQMLVWSKVNPLPLKNNKYLSDTEWCLFIRNNSPYFNNGLGFERYKSVYHQPLMHSLDGHPTPKPLNIIMNQITISSRPKDIVLDLFMGSGTTGVACERLNRRWIGIEISPEYCKIAEERIQKERNQMKLF